jgi:hypothetical protein
MKQAKVWWAASGLILLLFLFLRFYRVSQNLGLLPQSPDSQVIVAQAFAKALNDNPHVRVVRIYFFLPSNTQPSNPQRFFLQYDRWTKKPYFGSGGSFTGHGGETVAATSATCEFSEQQMQRELRRVVEAHSSCVAASSCYDAFLIFSPGRYCS